MSQREDDIKRARSMVSQWVTAEEAVMTGQEYRICTRMLRRADLRMIGERIKYYIARICSVCAHLQEQANKVIYFDNRSVAMSLS